MKYSTCLSRAYNPVEEIKVIHQRKKISAKLYSTNYKSRTSMEKEPIHVSLNNLEKLMEMRELKMGLDKKWAGRILTGLSKGEGKGRTGCIQTVYKFGERHSMWRQASV